MVCERVHLASDSVRPLFDERSSPGAGTYSYDAGEDARHVTLIREAASQCHFRQRQSPIAQLLPSYVDAMRQKPVVRCCSNGAAKRV